MAVVYLKTWVFVATLLTMGEDSFARENDRIEVGNVVLTQQESDPYYFSITHKLYSPDDANFTNEIETWFFSPENIRIMMMQLIASTQKFESSDFAKSSEKAMRKRRLVVNPKTIDDISSTYKSGLNSVSPISPNRQNPNLKTPLDSFIDNKKNIMAQLKAMQEKTVSELDSTSTTERSTTTEPLTTESTTTESTTETLTSTEITKVIAASKPESEGYGLKIAASVIGGVLLLIILIGLLIYFIYYKKRHIVTLPITTTRFWDSSHNNSGTISND